MPCVPCVLCTVCTMCAMCIMCTVHTMSTVCTMCTVCTVRTYIPCLLFVPCVPCVPSVLRKLSEKHKNVEGKLERRDVIKDYSSYSSQVYAPMTRIGVFLDSNAHQYQVSSHYKDTLYGLLELEAGLPAALVRPRYGMLYASTSSVYCTYVHST